MSDIEEEVEEEVEEEENENGNKIVCEDCGERFLSADELDHHNKTVH